MSNIMGADLLQELKSPEKWIIMTPKGYYMEEGMK